MLPPGAIRAYSCVEGGGLAGTRTRDPRLKRPLLYRLSYQPEIVCAGRAQRKADKIPPNACESRASTRIAPHTGRTDVVGRPVRGEGKVPCV